MNCHVNIIGSLNRCLTQVVKVVKHKMIQGSPDVYFYNTL